MGNNTGPKIGIVSGVGPLAGSDVFDKLIAHAATHYGAVEDCEYPDAILVNHGIIGVDNTAALNSAFEVEIADMVHWLETQGATVIGIACNTAHLYIQSMKVKPQVTLVNLIDEVAQKAALRPQNYLLLTSHASKNQKLYHPYLQKHGVKFVETNELEQLLLDKAIGLIMAHKLDEAGDCLTQVLTGAVQAGFKAVIAGCTELPIAIVHAAVPKGMQVIDSNAVLAQTLVARYYADHGVNSK